MFAARRDADHFLALVPQFHGCDEARGGWLAFRSWLEVVSSISRRGKYQALLNRLFDLFDLHLAEALDLQQCLACGAMDRLGLCQRCNNSIDLGMISYSNRVEAICLKLGDVGCSNAVGLDGVNVHDEVLTIESSSASEDVKQGSVTVPRHRIRCQSLRPALRLQCFDAGANRR